MNETSKILNQDEKVIWEGKPQFLPYFFDVIPIFIVGIIWSALIAPFLIPFLIRVRGPWYIYLIFAPFMLIGLYLIIGSWLIQAISYKYIWYALTDKRLIKQSGIIGRDFGYADYDKVTSAHVDVGILDKLFGKGSGSIHVITGVVIESSGATPIGGMTLSHIKDPYNVFELFKKASFDVKADINYPNALRPKENTGYKTQYKSDETK